MGSARWALACAAAVLIGCGDSSGPPAPVNVTGGWSFSVKDLTTTGLGFSCSVAGTMQLTQSGDAFTGTYHMASFVCSNGFSAGSGDGNVVAGEVFAGDSVHFHFDAEELDQHGIVTDSRTTMAGRSTWTTTDGSNTVTLTGSWSARR
jgi:hypothetical protein